MRRRHKIAVVSGLVAGLLMAVSAAVACTYTVGTTEVGPSSPVNGGNGVNVNPNPTTDTTSFQAWAQIGPSAEQPYFDMQADDADWTVDDYNDAVEADYYMYTFHGELSDLNEFPCLGDAQVETKETHKSDVGVVTNPEDQGKVITATETIDPDKVDHQVNGQTGLVMVCFASTDEPAPADYQPADGPEQPKFSTYWAPFRVFN